MEYKFNGKRDIRGSEGYEIHDFPAGILSEKIFRFLNLEFMIYRISRPKINGMWDKQPPPTNGPFSWLFSDLYCCYSPLIRMLDSNCGNSE